jgi:hypothetical protein
MPGRVEHLAVGRQLGDTAPPERVEQQLGQRRMPLGVLVAEPDGGRDEVLVPGVGVEQPADLLGDRAEALAYRAAAYCLSLGRDDGILQVMTHDGRPSALAARGWLGAFVKERIVRYTVGVLDRERRAIGRLAMAPRALPAPAVDR